MRTITQRTTLPFLMAESGAASFTAAVTTSPSPARRPRSPPRGRMQDSLRAPELSATSRIVRIPIIVATLLAGRRREPAAGRLSPAPGPRPLAPVLHFHVQIHRRRPHLGDAPNHVRQAPPLELAQGPALHDAHDRSEEHTSE